MERKMIVTVNDYKRLIGMTEVSPSKFTLPRIAEKLLTALKKAKMLPPENISNNIVTMNSRVLLREMSSGRQTEVTISYPQEADHQERRVSVFSPIGAALLGSREGDIKEWAIPTGIGSFKIQKVTYQPEAAGHYYL
jgi:regulator of nucleoside diphosphate kinase